MQKASSGSWWSFGFGKPAEAPQTDYADMGTAFGLDASMDSLPVAVDPASDNSGNGRPPVEGAGRRSKG